MALNEWKAQFNTLFKQIKQRLANLRGRGATGLVGLDISPASIKVLKINSAKNEISNFAMAPLPSGVIVKDEIKDQNLLADILRDVFRQADSKSKSVAIAIPRSSTIIKTITVDSRLKNEDIEARAWIEANRLFPDLVGDINLDFTLVGPSAQDSSQLEMILVACRKDQLKPYLETLRLAGLTAKVVDVNSYALERALGLINPEMSTETVALLNINTNVSTLIVVNKGNLVYAHDQTYDGQRLLNQVQEFKKRNANVSTHESANTNTTPAAPESVPPVNPDTTDNAYMNILKESLSSHLRHTMHFFYSSRSNISIQKIIVSGDCATLAELPTFIRQEIGIETSVANPFSKVTFAPQVKIEELKRQAPTLMLCCGLALTNPE